MCHSRCRRRCLGDCWGWNNRGHCHRNIECFVSGDDGSGTWNRIEHGDRRCDLRGNVPRYNVLGPSWNPLVPTHWMMLLMPVAATSCELKIVKVSQRPVPALPGQVRNHKRERGRKQEKRGRGEEQDCRENRVPIARPVSDEYHRCAHAARGVIALRASAGTARSPCGIGSKVFTWRTSHRVPCVCVS